MEKEKEEIYSPVEIKFDLEELLDYQYFQGLLFLLDKSVRDHVKISCEYSRQFCGFDGKGNNKYKVDAHYSFKFFGDNKTVEKVLKYLQKIYPDYFIGLEEE